MPRSGGKVHFENKIARIVGSLFIITMIVGMVDAYFVAPILKTPLSNIFPNDARVIAGAFLIIAMSVGIVAIAVCLYPVLKIYSEIIAISYVSLRVIEWYAFTGSKCQRCCNCRISKRLQGAADVRRRARRRIGHTSSARQQSRCGTL
jgi:hypothetical protein